ncbi:unnamed protein product [Symbiodinium sp. KB8]|nr:unnamed protein product [Symbiodinium sp. KB8]
MAAPEPPSPETPDHRPKTPRGEPRISEIREDSKQHAAAGDDIPQLKDATPSCCARLADVGNRLERWLDRVPCLPGIPPPPCLRRNGCLFRRCEANSGCFCIGRRGMAVFGNFRKLFLLISLVLSMIGVLLRGLPAAALSTERGNLHQWPWAHGRYSCLQSDICRDIEADVYIGLEALLVESPKYRIYKAIPWNADNCVADLSSLGAGAYCNICRDASRGCAAMAFISIGCSLFNIWADVQRMRARNDHNCIKAVAIAPWRSSPSAAWKYWEGAWSPRQQKPTEMRYDQMVVPEANWEPAEPSSDGTPTFHQALQRTLTTAKKLDMKLRKLAAEKERRQKQWHKYEEDFKRAFAKQKRNFEADLKKLDQEVMDAHEAGNVASAQVKALAIRGAPPPPQEDAMEVEEAWSSLWRSVGEPPSGATFLQEALHAAESSGFPVHGVVAPPGLAGMEHPPVPTASVTTFGHPAAPPQAPPMMDAHSGPTEAEQAVLRKYMGQMQRAAWESQQPRPPSHVPGPPPPAPPLVAATLIAPLPTGPIPPGGYSAAPSPGNTAHRAEPYPPASPTPVLTTDGEPSKRTETGEEANLEHAAPTGPAAPSKRAPLKDATKKPPAHGSLGSVALKEKLDDKREVARQAMQPFGGRPAEGSHPISSARPPGSEDQPVPSIVDDDQEVAIQICDFRDWFFICAAFAEVFLRSLLEIVPDPLPTLGITVFAPHYALGHVPGPGFDAFIPVRLSPPRCAVLVDLTRVGGHYFAETIPAAITLAEFLQLFGKNMWYDAEEVLVWVDGSELPASPGELAFAHGSVFEVMLRQYHPGNAVADGVCVTHTRPLGFQMTVLYRDVEPGVEDVQHLTQSVFPPGCVVTAHCVTQHDKRHLYLPVIQVDVQDIGDAPVAPLCSEIGGSDTGQTQCKGPSEATSNLRAAVEAVAQEHPGLLPEPFHRIGPVPPFLPQPVEADTDEDVEGADEPRTVRATCLLFVYEMTHEEVHLSLPVPCTVQGMLDALTQQCDDARYTLFPQHVPVDPQPTQWWIAVIALPPWANAEPLILLNLDTIDGRCFVASVRTPFNRSHILRIAQLVDDGTYEVFPFYAFTPMQADDLIELVPYGTVTVRRAGARRVVQGHGLHTMLLAGTTWDDDPTLPIPPAGNRSLLVHEHGHGLVHPRSGNDMPTPAEVAAVCGANADTVQVIEASPQPLNALCCGYLCQKVLGVSFTEDNLLTPGQPYTGVTFVDCRALLLGWSLEVSLEGRLRHSTVVDWLDTFSPDGWQPQLTGAPIDDEGWLHAAPGSILVAEYVPVTSSEEGEVQGAGSTSDSSPGDDDESTVDERAFLVSRFLLCPCQQSVQRMLLPDLAVFGDMLLRLFRQLEHRLPSERFLASHRLDICVYAATDDFPLADDVLLHFSTGDTIRFVHPGGPPPSQDTLPAALLTTRGWTDRSTLPVPQVDNVYCLVHRDGNVMYFANHAEPMAYRTRIATALGLGRQGFRLFPAVPRVTDAYLDGIPCRTVIAVCETGQEFPEPFVGVLFDLRAVSQGWRAIYAYHGRVHCPGLFEDVREFIPLGWAPALRHVPLHTVFLDVQAGQVLVLELHPYVTRAPDALAPTVGPDAATEGETSDVGGMHAAAHSATAPDGAIDTVEDAAEAAGHHSTETAAEDTEDITIAGDAVVGTSLHVLVFTPEYAPETIHIRVELPLTIAELTAIVTPLRDATVRFRFPQLISPPVQPAFATACLLALPAWDPPCVPILIACYVSPVRVFADVVPAVLTPGDVCRLAQVTDDGQCRVFHADVPWAVPDDTRFHVQAGDLVIVLPVEQPYVPPVLLQYMLLHPEGWQQGPCPFGPYEDGVWLLTDQVHRFFAAPAPPRPPIKEAVADLVGVPYDSLTFMPASPPIRDQARYGLPARQVFVAMQQLHPDAVPYIIDCRPVLLGFLCAFAPDGIVQVANVCGHHVHRCPPGYFVRLTGGARQSDTDNHYRVVFPGQVLVLDYCPRRVSLPFDASAAGPGSDDDDDDHPPGDDRDLDEPDDPSEDATSSRPDAGTGSTQCFPPAEESAAAGSSHHSAMCSLVFAKWGSGSHAHAFPEGHRYFTPDKSLLTALLKLFCLCSAGFLLLRVLPALFLCATACHTFSRRSSLPSRPGLLLRLCVALLLHMYVPAVDAVQLPIEPKLDGRLADTAVRPLPTPCRRPALELPGTEQAVCTSVDPRRPQSRTVDDIASFSFELLTLLEESAARPDFEGFFDASTLLDTLVEHFGLAAVDHDPDPACDVGVVLCLHESVPPTPFQVRALELQAIVPAPVDPAAYWDGVVLDWLDVDLSHILTATDLPDTLRRSFLALPTAAQLDPQATVSSLVIYTDGSAGRRHDCDISPAAWSFAVWACQNSELYLLGHSAHSTVPCGTPFFLGEPDDTPFTAECLALAWALVWSLEYGAGLGVPIEFRYDCVGAGLGTFGRAQLCAKDSTEGHATLFSFLGILRQALELRATVHHCHVRGHSGDPGNELCDRLAKAARRVPEDCQERCLPAWPHQWFVHPLASWGWLATYARSDLPTLAALEAESVRLQTSEARPSAPSMGMHTCKHQPSTTGYDIAVATFNVLSLFDPQAPKGRQKRVPNVGMMIAGKKDLLKQQFLAKQLWLVGLQETRLPTQSTLPDADFVILCTAANAAGQYGCALWVNKHVVYARDDGTEHRLRSEHLVVAACSERYLQVHIVAPRLKLAVLVVHGPKAKHDHDPEVRLFWQARLCDLRRRPKGSDYIVLTDANAHLGSVETDHVGGHGVEPENWEGECFHEFLCQAGACLPSTFALHVGQNWTWRAPGQAATVHRLDYVAIPTEWKSFVTESTVWCDIEALQARQDHLPACLSLSFRKTMPAHYSSHLTRSACRPTTTPTDAMRHAFTQALRRSGSVAWSVDVDQHFHSWVDNIKHAAESLCEAAVKTPRQPYLCEHTLGLVERRRALRFLLRQEEAEYRRRTLMIAFAAVVLHTRQDVFTPTTAARAEDWLISLDHSIAMLVRLFHEATTAIRAAVKRDRQQYLASLADQEGGVRVQPETYAQVFLDPDIPVHGAQTVFSVKALPTLQDLERQLLRAKYRKACGPDGITAECLRIDAPAVAKLLFPVCLKASLGLREPTEWRGGSLHCLAKKAQTSLACKGYRSILMASVAGKAHHRILRGKLLPYFADYRADLQYGQLPGVGVEGVAHVVRTYQALTHHRRRVCSATFFDIKTAFYQVVRQALIPTAAGATDTKLLSLLYSLRVPDAAIDELVCHLRTIAALPHACDDAHLTGQIADLFRGSWFRLDGASPLVHTRKGTRPGDPLADLLFGFLFAAYLKSAEQALMDRDLATYVPQCAGGAVFADLHVAHIGCMAWADDFAHLQSALDSAALCQRVVHATGLLATHATAHGMELTFAVDKSAVLLCSGCGRVPDGVLCQDEDGQLGLWIHDDITQRWHFLPVVDSYRHLGTIAVSNATPGPEIAFRYAKAKAMLLPLRRKLFANPEIPLTVEQAPHSYTVLATAAATSPLLALAQAMQDDPEWWPRMVKRAIRAYASDLAKCVTFVLLVFVCANILQLMLRGLMDFPAQFADEKKLHKKVQAGTWGAFRAAPPPLQAFFPRLPSYAEVCAGVDEEDVPLSRLRSLYRPSTDTLQWVQQWIDAASTEGPRAEVSNVIGALQLLLAVSIFQLLCVAEFPTEDRQQTYRIALTMGKGGALIASACCINVFNILMHWCIPVPAARWKRGVEPWKDPAVGLWPPLDAAVQAFDGTLPEAAAKKGWMDDGDDDPVRVLMRAGMPRPVTPDIWEELHENGQEGGPEAAGKNRRPSLESV